jgi:hypothetical protein
MPGVATSRRVIARSRDIALELRGSPVDVLADYGLVVPPSTDDPDGLVYLDAYVNEPARFIVTGALELNRHVELVFKGRPEVHERVTATSTALATQSGGMLSVCADLKIMGHVGLIDAQVAPDADLQLVGMRGVKNCA